jgi:two-component system cell cycle sensor histidine kinase/response regulator CckA
MATWPAYGRPSGFMIEVLDEAARRSGYFLDWRSIVVLEDNNQALRRGDVDLVVGVDTPGRRREFLVTEPWWSVGVAAVVRAGSPIRAESDLPGKHLAVTTGSSWTVGTDYPGSVIEPRDSPAHSAEAVCLGEADAAMMEEMFLREVLLSRPQPCQGLDLRAIDTHAQVDFALICRKNAATAARALKSALDDLTADGTLAAIAARHAQLSEPYAVQLAEAARLRFARRMWVIGMAAALVLALLVGVFALKLSHSRRRLRHANRRLQVDLQARIKAEAALRDSEARFRALFDSAPQSVFAIDRDGAVVFANRKSEDMFGQPAERLIGRSLEALLPARLHAAFRKDRLANEREVFGLRAGGEEFPIEIVLGSVETGDGLTLAFLSDISERVALEQQFLKAQKLESVAHLAGGVAHDFNNLLTVIQGYARMSLAEPSSSDDLRESLTEIVCAADRAASLTRQLLMFSRRQAGAPRTISLNDLLGNLEKMLRRLIGEDIELLFLLDPRTAAVRADPAHIEQVALNLSINARNAMPEGGKLIVETAAVHADAAYAHHTGVQPGDYALMKVTDTGTGMTPEVKAHIFEPFFTTKQQGKGTGLGLSTVYGIVKQSGGAIYVHSEPGQGTSFSILFPAAEAQPKEAKADDAPQPLSGSETILIAEDEPGVRKFIHGVLQSAGYRVLDAVDGANACEIAASERGPIHLLISDVVMPGMSGADLAVSFARMRPEAPTLLMSGYSERALGSVPPGALLEKPFTPEALLRRVRETLEK